MLSLDQCIVANRPLIFVTCESDIEVLKYLEEKHNHGNYYVYSTTLTRTVRLKELLDKKFSPDKERPQTTVDVLSSILNRPFHDTNTHFETFVFLDCNTYVSDKQIIRMIKDIVTRYQLDTEFTVNLIMVSQTVCVPVELERLSEVVFFDLPDETALKGISDTVTTKLELKGDQCPSEEVVNNLKGLTLFEVEQAYIQSFMNHKKIDLTFIRDFKKASIAKTDLLSLMDPGVSFDDIGGMETLKQWVIKSWGGWSVEGKKFGLPLLKGLLMIGPPGCGKSLLAKTLAHQWGLPAIAFDPSRVFSSRVGESEYNIRRVLQIVENISPAVIFIDEIEKAFAGSQSSTFSDSGVTARVIGTFLTWMQDCTKPVFTVATSNNIQYLPPELIQRFDEKFFVNLPQFNERREIFSIHIKKLNRDPDKFDLSKLSENSRDFSGREIEQALREAMYDAFHAKKESKDPGLELTTEIILNVLSKKTNLLSTMGEQLGFMFKWVGWDENKKDGVRARYSAIPDNGDVERVQSEIDKLIGEVEKSGGMKDKP